MERRVQLLGITLFSLVLLALSPIQAQAVDEVHFVGGAPLDTYQPSVIVPILQEAFARNNINFKATHYPSARSLVMSNSGAADGELHRVYNFQEVSKGKYPNLIRGKTNLFMSFSQCG